MEIIAEFGSTLLVVACVLGFFMAWGIGSNDVANAMGTSVGAKALTLTGAILVACIFEFAGAYLAGGEVTETCLLYTSPSPRDVEESRMPSSA